MMKDTLMIAPSVKSLDLDDPNLRSAVKTLLAHQHAVGVGDEDEADRLMGDLEYFQRRLTWEQNEWVRGVSGDLEALSDDEVLEPNKQLPDQYLAALTMAWGNVYSDPHHLLMLLRKDNNPFPKSQVSFGRSRAYDVLGFPDLSEAFLLNAIRLDPQQMYYQCDLMSRKVKDRLYTEATKIGDAILLSPTISPLVTIMVASQMYLVVLRGDLTENERRPLLGEARAALTAILGGQRNPHLDKHATVTAMIVLGFICGGLRRASEAKDWFSRAIDMDPYLDEGYVAMGNLLYDSDRRASTDYYRHAVSLGTKNSLPYLCIAQADLENGNSQEAVEMADNAIRFAENTRSIALGNEFAGVGLLKRDGMTDEAFGRLRRAAELWPENKMIWSNYQEALTIQREEETLRQDQSSRSSPMGGRLRIDSESWGDSALSIARMESTRYIESSSRLLAEAA